MREERMDEEPQRDRLSLIPYPSSDQTQIVLRHKSTVVLYDAKSKKVILQSGASADDTACPYCNRPFASPNADHDPDGPLNSPTAEASFMDPGYFRMLHWSRDTSRQSSRSPSPKRLAPPSQSGVHTPQPSSSPAPGSSEPKGGSRRISSDAFSPNYFKTFFVEENVLGRGGNGVVLLVRHFIGGVDLGLFACKRIPVGNDSKWLRKVLVEVQLLQTLSHQNLVSYKHVWLEDFKPTTFGPSVPCAFVLMQYCNAGDLHNYIFGQARTMSNEQLKRNTRARSKSKLEPPEELTRHMPFDEIFNFFRDITSGLNYLHNMGYVHRDLKPSNCLLHRASGSRIRCLLSDFGETQGSGITRDSTGNTGTISFCAPEVLTPDAALGGYGNFTTRSDVYSLGIVLHLMCFSRLPYSGVESLSGEIVENADQLRAEISAWDGWSIPDKERSDLPDKLYKYLALLLSRDPHGRPDTSEILQNIKSFPFHQHPETVILDDAAPPPPSRRSTDMGRRGSSFGKPEMEKSTIIQRRAHISGEPRSPQTPRLMPPPERSILRREGLLQLLKSPGFVALSRLALFTIKVWSISSPCSPLAARGSTFYLVLAAADLVLSRSFLRSVILLVLHSIMMMFAWQLDMLCELDRPVLQVP